MKHKSGECMTIQGEDGDWLLQVICMPIMKGARAKEAYAVAVTALLKDFYAVDGFRYATPIAAGERMREIAECFAIVTAVSR
jgi:hypothetical protein